MPTVSEDVSKNQGKDSANDRAESSEQQPIMQNSAVKKAEKQYQEE